MIDRDSQRWLIRGAITALGGWLWWATVSIIESQTRLDYFHGKPTVAETK